MCAGVFAQSRRPFSQNSPLFNLTDVAAIAIHWAALSPLDSERIEQELPWPKFSLRCL